jgi:hypothetical protein
MVTVIIILNILVALLCLYLACWFWQLRQTLLSVTIALIQAEQSCHYTLRGAPRYILMGQEGTQWFRHQCLKLEQQIHEVNRLLALINLGWGLWGRWTKVKPRSSRGFYSGHRFR